MKEKTMRKDQQSKDPKSMHHLSRRSFYKGLGLGLGGVLGWGGVSLSGDSLATIEQGLAQESQSNGGRYFMHLCLEGGWDLLLGLDPRNPLDYPDQDASATGIETGYTRLPIQFSREPIRGDHFELGPCAEPLHAWSEQIALVRGLDMATLTHEVGRRHLNTAVAPSGLSARGSSVSTRIAALTEVDGGQQVIPHLAHLVESYNQDQMSSATALQVSSVDHLQYLLQETLGIPSYMPVHIRGALNRYWEKQQNEYERHWQSQQVNTESKRLLDRALKTRVQARRLVTRSLHESFQFNADHQASLRAHYGIAPNQLDTPFGRAALAAQALKTGLSRSVHLNLVNNLDTHDQQWAQDHSTSLYNGFLALSKLLEDLANSPDPLGGGSLLDQTTIVVSSEFSRTPRLNVRGGRDHHLCNAALLIGRGIQGGQVLGASTNEFMSPLRINYATGQVDPNGRSIRPEDLMRTAIHAMGLTVSDTAIRGEVISSALA